MSEPDAVWSRPEVELIPGKVAREVVEKVMLENEPKYGGLWKEQTVGEHLDHALEHVVSARLNGKIGSDAYWEDIEHALCRLAMLICVSNEK